MKNKRITKSDRQKIKSARRSVRQYNTIDTSKYLTAVKRQNTEVNA